LASVYSSLVSQLSYSHRKEYVGFIGEAKKEETRARRVDQTIRALEQRA